jgi:8-oxo-dGTP pyrophosphatase MutT (NUDIX family)
MSGGVALLSSCSNDKIDEPTTEPAAVDDDDLVYITIMTDDAASRAVYEETEITGTAAESYINPETIHLYPYNFTASGYPSCVVILLQAVVPHTIDLSLQQRQLRLPVAIGFILNVANYKIVAHQTTLAAIQTWSLLQ